MLVEAAKTDVTELPMSGVEFDRYLNAVTDPRSDEEGRLILLALAKAKPDDGSDFSSTAVKFITTTAAILPEVREAIVQEVLSKTTKTADVPALVDFARGLNDTKSIVAIYGVARDRAGDDMFGAFLTITQFAAKPEERKAAENTATAIIKRSGNRQKMLEELTTAIKSTNLKPIQNSLLRIQTAGSSP
jgi:pyruvoyl-dependent arginine decarboxylase (PvlArgDC)